MTGALDARRRENYFRDLAREKWDVLVIGGGVTGAGIALDAASRGYRTALVEMGDLASGTSSRSTKLVHGGLRYLKQLEIKLVAEVGRERAVVHGLAPHLVLPQPMLLPILKGGSMGKCAVSLALWVYDRLAGVKGPERRKMLSRAQTLVQEPLLGENRVKGAGYYFEYQTDDARLTLALARTARSQGASVHTYAEGKELLYSQGKVVGLKVADRLGSEAFEVKAKVVINACGPWADFWRKADGSLNDKHLQLTKGVHIVVDAARFPLRQAAYFDAPGGRMVFAIPREGKVYIGTTDTLYGGDPREPGITLEDAKYLLAAVEEVFPSVNLGLSDIKGTWSGVRPLIHQKGKGPGELSRKDEVFVAESGLVTIAGGKLTGYRKMAERVVDMVETRLGKRKECQTQSLPLVGSGNEAFVPAVGWEKVAGRWWHRYGVEATGVMEHAQKLAGEGLEPWLAGLYAEIGHTIQNEGATCLTDFLVRRTGMLYFEREESLKVAGRVGEEMGRWLGWDAQRLSRELAEFQKLGREALPWAEG